MSQVIGQYNCIAVYAVLISNADECWLVIIPYELKIISEKPVQKEKKKQPVDVSLVLQFVHILV